MLLYQLLSGTLPFWEEGESQSPFTVMTAILGGEVSFDGPAWQAISPHGASSPRPQQPLSCVLRAHMLYLQRAACVGLSRVVM